MDNSTTKTTEFPCHSSPSPPLEPSISIDFGKLIAQIHAQRGTSAIFGRAIQDNSFIEFWYAFHSLKWYLTPSQELCGKYKSCALTFQSQDERDNFIAKQQNFIPESSAFKSNIWLECVEVIMPESFLHSQVNFALYECCIEALLTQCYAPGTRRWDTGIMQAGSPSISL